MVADFWDEGDGAFYSTPRGHEVLLARVSSAEDQALPSGQSMAALSLMRLSRLTVLTRRSGRRRRGRWRITPRR